MTLSLFVFVPISIFVAHYRLSWADCRHTLSAGAITRSRPITGEEWLDAHLTIMLIGVGFSVLGWVIAFLSTAQNFRSWHSVIGSIVVFTIVFIQPHLAYDGTWTR